MFTDVVKPLAWRTLKELNGLSSKGRLATWYDRLIDSLLNLEEEEIVYEDSPDSSVTEPGIKQSTLSPCNFSKYSYAHIWNLLKQCSKKRSSKPFVVFKTWDTNDRSVNAQQIYKIGKVTNWDNKNRVTILIYQIYRSHDSEWVVVSPSSSSIRWIPISETRQLSCRSQNSLMQVHRDWISLITQWNQAANLIIRTARNADSQFDSRGLEESPSVPLIRLPECYSDQDVWIDRWVSNSNLNLRLKNIGKELACEQDLTFYTDGSLRQEQPLDINGYSGDPVTCMGAAFVNKHQPELNCSARILNWPSSTRAELAAIFMALLVTPENVTVAIHTDSLAAIQLIRKCGSQYSSKKWLKTSNVVWILYIETIIREKHLKLDLVKVRGHSGDTFNDLADEYAKLGGNSDDILDLGFVSANSNLTFLPHFRNVPIEQKIRKFTVSTLKFFNCAEWSRLQSQRINFSHQQFNWTSSWLLFKNLIGFRCNRVKKNVDWFFLFKIFHKALPLGHLLKLRRPDIYKHMGCIKCGSSVDETWEHFISCDPHEDIWINLHNALDTELRILFKSHAHKDIINDQIDFLIRALIGPTKDSVTFRIFKQHACEGKMTIQSSIMIKNKLHLSPILSGKVDALVLLMFLHLFKSLIWIPRCALQIIWEERQRIDQKMKMCRPPNSPNNTALMAN